MTTHAQEHAQAIASYNSYMDEQADQMAQKYHESESSRQTIISILVDCFSGTKQLDIELTIAFFQTFEAMPTSQREKKIYLQKEIDEAPNDIHRECCLEMLQQI